MQIPILIEPVVGNGFRASSGEPVSLVAEGATRDEAIHNKRRMLDKRLSNGSELIAAEIAANATGNSWVDFAGRFKDDPCFDEWQKAIAENRQMNEDPDVR